MRSSMTRGLGILNAPTMMARPWASKTQLCSRTAIFLQYSYVETGYLTNASCINNASSKWVISELVINGTVGEPDLFKAIGYFPNSNWTKIYEDQSSGSEAKDVDWYAQVDTGNGSTVVSIGSHSSDQVSRYFVAIAAGADYAQLDKIQCELTFAPTSFMVQVSSENSTITVVPNGAASDPEPKGLLRYRVLEGLNTLSES